ncbi:hypothetical protein T265_16057, partial [Opisthorchis viverrini]
AQFKRQVIRQVTSCRASKRSWWKSSSYGNRTVECLQFQRIQATSKDCSRSSHA